MVFAFLCVEELGELCEELWEVDQYMRLALWLYNAEVRTSSLLRRPIVIYRQCDSTTKESCGAKRR